MPEHTAHAADMKYAHRINNIVGRRSKHGLSALLDDSVSAMENEGHKVARTKVIGRVKNQAYTRNSVIVHLDFIVCA